MYTVLLTDDEPAILKALSDRIPWQQFGVDALTAADGLEALDVMKDKRVDLLITDIRMPHMDGIELLHKVREKYPATHCILLTAYSEFEYARTAMQLGVENYLLKPFQKEEMEATIEKALENIYTSRENSKHLFRNNILLRSAGRHDQQRRAWRAFRTSGHQYLSARIYERLHPEEAEGLSLRLLQRLRGRIIRGL